MQVIQKIFSGIFLIFSFSALHAQKDSVMYQRDSAVVPETNPTVLFFQQGEKTTTPNKIFLVTKARKTMTMTGFLKTLVIIEGTSSPSSIDYCFADLDNDGKKELVISNYTGGAHCCDEIYIFKNVAPNRYQHVAKFYAGNTSVTKNNEFVYNLYEQFGYFFTCYACAYSDTSDAAPIQLRDIMLKYNKGKIIMVQGDKEMRSTLLDNLGKLSEQPYEKLADDHAQDNGLRKEFAINLAMFYYSYGKNIAETQQLFNKFYKYPDAKKVWAAFTNQLQYMKKDNDF
jgi:hypothetical protein